MKHEITTLQTKKLLAASLKRCMESRPLSKITVSEIVRDCGVNRKTFYYHFSDVYALLKWMLEAEAIAVVRRFDLLTDCRAAVLFVLDYVRSNRHLLCCAYDSMGRDEMKRFFYADFVGVISSIIQSSERELGTRVTPGFRDFLTQLYTEAIAGMLISEFTADAPHDPEKAVEYLSLILKTSLPGVLINAPQEK